MGELKHSTDTRIVLNDVPDLLMGEVELYRCGSSALPSELNRTSAGSSPDLC